MNTSEHLLTCLSEECCEVSKNVSKALRFGLDDRNILNPTGPTNRERLLDEMNDVVAVMGLLVDIQVFPEKWSVLEKVLAKRAKVKKFLQYSKDVGTLND